MGDGAPAAAELGLDLLGWTDTAVRAIGELRGWTPDAIARLELTYAAHRVGIPVRDELGDELGEVRYSPTSDQSPKMLQPSGVPRQLFPPPETVDERELGPDRTIWLVEGEPDAIRLWSLGLAAVGVPGAQNWRDEWAARFTGQHWRVVVCFDCDPVGREHAERAAASIVAAGGDARLVELDGDRSDGYDLTDFTSAATSADLREQAASALTTIAAATGLYQPQAAPADSNGASAGDLAGRPWRSIPWPEFRDQAPPEHRWLIDGLLPAGQLGFVAGPPKRGKTWLGIAAALSVALGRPFAEHPVPEARDVLYTALEGSQVGLRTRIGALARGLGADPDTDELARLHMLYRPRPFNLIELGSAEWLFAEALETDAALVIVDVLRAAARFQENAAEDFARIRDHLDPLLAAGRTVVLLHHFGKLTETQKERSPGERMAGTGAMYGALDVGLLLTRSEDGARRLRVDVEARDFAAPDALGLVIDGAGSGKHGGFTYDDSARVLLDATAAADRDLAAEALELLDGLDDGLGADVLAKDLKVGRRELETALDADATKHRDLGEPPLVVRWDRERDGRFPGRAHNYQPFLTFVRYELARAEQLELG